MTEPVCNCTMLPNPDPRRRAIRLKAGCPVHDPEWQTKAPKVAK